MENPYYVGPQTMSKNPADYMQGVQALGQSYAQGEQDFQGSGGQQAFGAANSALQGASVGMAIGGPVGAAVGAGAGALAYGVGNAIGTNQFIKDAELGQMFSQDGEAPSYDFQQQQEAMQTADQLGSIANKSWLGNAALKRKDAGAKQRQIQRGIQSQQNQFNTANTQYQQGLLQRQAYQDQLNNVYNIPMGYF